MIIDTHAHFVPPSLLDDVKTQRRLFPSLKTREENGQLCFSFAGAEMGVRGRRRREPLHRGAAPPEERTELRAPSARENVFI